MARLYNWVKSNRVYGLLAGIIGLTLFTVISIKVFFFPVDIPTGTVAAYSAFIGTGLIAVFALWKEARDGSDSSKK